MICKDLLKKETNIEYFNGLKVTLSTGEKGVIEGTFGQSGKIKIRIPGNIFYFFDIKTFHNKISINLQSYNKKHFNF